MDANIYDPTNHSHRTQASWALGGQPWLMACFLHALQHGESRCLLHSGYVIRFFMTADGKVDLEVVHETH